MMDKEIALAVNRSLFQLQAPAHVQIVNARRNARSTMTSITDQNATGEMALLYRDIIIKATRSVDKEIIDVEGYVLWDRLKIYAVRQVRFIGQGTKGLQMLREGIQRENKGVTIRVQVRWLSIARTIMEREQRGEMKPSSVVFIVKRKKVAQRLVSTGVTAVGVRYKVEPYTIAERDSLVVLCCRTDHIESMCNHQPKCGFSTGHH
jgi:hypothetical protein